jgi:prepilin-type N-terminal cleavage/methylation domain-containing protein
LTGMEKKHRGDGGSWGFTLMEMLAVIVVLVILAAGMMTGLSVATRAYRKSVFASDSEVLQSTLNTALGDILRYAAYERTDDDGMVRFSNEFYQVTSDGYFVLSEGRLYIETGGSAGRIRVINSGAYTDLVISAMTVMYDTIGQNYSGQYTIASSDGTLTKDCTFSYRTLR